MLIDGATREKGRILGFARRQRRPLKSYGSVFDDSLMKKEEEPHVGNHPVFAYDAR